MKYTTVKTWQRGDWNSLHFHYNYTKIVKSNPTRTFTPIQALHRVRFREWKRNTFTCSSNTTGTWNAPMIKVLGTDRHERNLDRHVRDTQRYYDTDRKKKKKKERKKGRMVRRRSSRKERGRKARTHAIWETPSDIGPTKNGQMWWESKRGETANCRRSSIVAEFAPRFFSLSFSFLPPLSFFLFFPLSAFLPDFRRYWENHAEEEGIQFDARIMARNKWRWLTKQWSRDHLLSSFEAIKIIKSANY